MKARRPMIYKLSRVNLWAVAIIFITMFFVLYAFNIVMGLSLFGRNGLCSEWQIGMTENEKIALSLKYTNEMPSITFDFKDPRTGQLYRTFGKQIPYNDVTSIMRFQPDCCHVYSAATALTDNPREDLQHGDEGIVVMRYNGRYEDETGAIRIAPVFAYDDLNDCK